MEIDEINRQAYHFVDVIKAETSKEESPQEHKGSLAQTEPIIVLDDIVGDYFVISSLLPNGNKYIQSIKSSGKEFSFDKQNLGLYRTFLKSVYKFHFQPLCSFDFLEDISYKWIIDVKNSCKSTIDFFFYLKEQIDSKVQNYNYYFPVFNLHIERDFEIGNVKFLFFTKEQLKYYNENNEFNKFYEKLLGKVFVSSTSKSESSKAKDVTFSECCLSFDVLKIFICDFLLPAEKLLVDIEHRASFNFSDNYFSTIDGNLDSISFTLGANNRPITLNADQLIVLQKKGIEKFSNFLKSEIDNELKAIIINAIKTFAVAVTNEDLHLRISLLLSVSEMLLLKESEKNFTACLCKKRFLSIVNKLNANDINKANEVLSEFYIVRNKYLHNGKRLQINLLHLSFFQQLIRILLINLIDFSKVNADKNSFLDNYDFIEECKKESAQKRKN